MSILGRVTVNRYRQFEQFELGGLRQVNLLVGRNNSGKTSLLEAIQIATSQPAVSALVDIAFRRGEVERDDDPAREPNGAYAAIRHLWQGHTPWPKPAIGPFFDTYSSINNLKNSVSLSIQPPASVNQADHIALLFNKRLGALQITRNDQNWPYPLTSSGLLSPSEARASVWDGESSAPIFLSTVGFTRQRLAELYNQAVKYKLERKAVAALNLLEPRVRDVFFLDSGSARSLMPGEGILVDTGDGERQPLGSMGDGMRSMLGLGLALANAERGTLLVDEIDTGIHYSAMADMWRLVVQTAIDLDIQIFATTHSLDCVRGLVEMGRKEPHLFEKAAVHKIDARRERSAVFTGDGLIAAVETGLELR